VGGLALWEFGMGQVREEVAEGVFGAVEAEDLQAGVGGTLPVAARIVAGVEGFAGGGAGEVQGLLENPGVRFVGADFAGDDDGIEAAGKAEMGEDGAQAAIEVGDQAEPEARAKQGEDFAHFREEFPDIWPGEFGIEGLEIEAAIELPRRDTVFVEDLFDECEPPAFVVIRTGLPGGGTSRHLEPRCAKGVGQFFFLQDTAEPGRDVPIMPADPSRQVKESAGGVEEDGHGRLCRKHRAPPAAA